MLIQFLLSAFVTLSINRAGQKLRIANNKKYSLAILKNIRLICSTYIESKDRKSTVYASMFYDTSDSQRAIYYKIE